MLSSSICPRVLQDATAGLFDAERELQRSVKQIDGRVSIICPTLDERALFHPQLYECFVAQTWSDKELVVIDTGITPSPFLQRAALIDARVVYRHYRCKGTAWPVGLKRNIAAYLASGSIIAHFDDDDIYAPGYIDTLVAAMGKADGITLSCWFVFDTCTGVGACVNPSDNGSQESWIFGYGFSHMYRRDACLAYPFPHDHFAEDYRFLIGLRNVEGKDVVVFRDEEGIVLHMQQGTNLSHSHGHRPVSRQELLQMPVSFIPGFQSFLEICWGQSFTSPFLSIGEPYRMYMRPTPHQREESMRSCLYKVGAHPCQNHRDWNIFDEEDIALLSCCVKRWGESFVEPGRLFAPTRRFLDKAMLPGDVPRMISAEHLALLFISRVLLRRCFPCLPANNCEGCIQLQLKTLSHIAVVGLLVQFIRHFPRIRLEVSFDSEGVLEDPGAAQRLLMAQLLAEHNLQ